jgi:L-asparaginase
VTNDRDRDCAGRVVLISLGGTIASQLDENGGGLAAPARSADDLLRGLPSAKAELEPVGITLRVVPSPDITVADVNALVELIGEVASRGARGVVVSQGTDTLEEVAFLLHVMLPESVMPVVLTAAMRHNDLLGSDAMSNLDAALRVAGSDEARSAGVLVVVNDEIHGPVFLTKGHTARLSTFATPGLGPIGWVTEGRVGLPYRPSQRVSSPLRLEVPELPVALVSVPFDDGAVVLSALARTPLSGLVIEGMGGGHVPARAVPELEPFLNRVPVVISSRARAGEVLRATYDFVGSEAYLLRLGAIGAGALGAHKARLLLMACLGSTDGGPRSVQERFSRAVEELHGR